MNRETSLSTIFAQLWQSQRPFKMLDRCFGDKELSKRGPPGEAAVMWLATPMLIERPASVWGPDVRRRHQDWSIAIQLASRVFF